MAFCILFVETFKVFPAHKENIENNLHTEEYHQLNLLTVVHVMKF